MNELTDLQICKRIAEIEGHETLPCDEYQEGDFYIVINDHGEDYNPLTDDALCFQLMVKYVYDDSPNKAICLAIIEAHKDKS